MSLVEQWAPKANQHQFMSMNNKIFSFMKFQELVLELEWHKICVTFKHTRTDRYFPKIVKSSLEQSKPDKSIKSQNSKIFANLAWPCQHRRKLKVIKVGGGCLINKGYMLIVF